MNQSEYSRRPFLKRFALCYRTVVCPVCLSVTLVYCGQTVGWIKMPLGTKVGLGPGHIVLGRDPAPSKKGNSSPNFRPMSIVAKRSPISATAEFLLKWPGNSHSNDKHEWGSDWYFMQFNYRFLHEFGRIGASVRPFGPSTYRRQVAIWIFRPCTTLTSAINPARCRPTIESIKTAANQQRNRVKIRRDSAALSWQLTAVLYTSLFCILHRSSHSFPRQSTSLAGQRRRQ